MSSSQPGPSDPSAPSAAAPADVLDDVAMLLVQLEPGDTAELEQVRQSLARLARATEDFDAAVALGGAATQLATVVSGGDEAQAAAALARANHLVESAMARLDATRPAAAAPAPAASGETLPDDVDADLLRDFIVESRDCIAASEAALLALESDPDDVEAVNTVFRGFHTIKGTAAFMGLSRVSEFAHHAESLLSRVRDREVAFAGHVADVALRATDMIGGLLAAVEAALGGAPLDTPDGYQELLDELVAMEHGGAGVGAPGPATRDRGPAAAGRTAARGAPPEHHDAAELADDPHPAPAAVIGPPPASPATAPARSGPPDGVDRRRGTDRRQGTDRRHDAELSVRVRTDRLDRLIDVVGELVIAQSMIAQDPAAHAAQNQILASKVSHAGKLVRDLQELAMSMRMVPMKPTFQKLARLVRDLAQTTGKQVELVTDGEETEIDRNMVDVIGDPLVHMVRNALDHGLESPADRVAAGKPATGTLRLSAYHAGGNVVVDLQDDGRGLDRAKILAKARAKGLVFTDKLSDGEVFDLIFAPGFSTADQISDISGRGVGMDVVKRNVESLRGRIEISSAAGQGTTFSVRLPLTLAVTDGMLVRVGAERYVVPTALIHMSFRPERGALSTVNGRGEMVLLREELMPVVHVHRLLGVPDAVADPAAGILMVVGDQEKRTALLVDELLGQHQLVVKSLGAGLAAVPGISGAAILGDGRVGLILDVAGLVALARTRDEPARSAA
ncbi:MAG TPA: chemotaxis protein CheA [Gemmatimonadaceae bacterium]|nr:chemotaxis protein CheA [Gemmatimonadaceae bacterium]